MAAIPRRTAPLQNGIEICLPSISWGFFLYLARNSSQRFSKRRIEDLLDLPVIPLTRFTWKIFKEITKHDKEKKFMNSTRPKWRYSLIWPRRNWPKCFLKKNHIYYYCYTGNMFLAVLRIHVILILENWIRTGKLDPH